MDRSQKADLVDELKNVFTETSVVVITRNHGLSVAQSTDLRLKMRDAGAQYKVAKNRLALIALDGHALQADRGPSEGPDRACNVDRPVAAAKVAVDFAKTNDKFEIVGGAMGDTVLDVNGIKALCRTPVARRTARDHRGPYPGARDQDRPHRQRAGRTAGTCLRCLCGKRPLRTTFHQRTTMGRRPAKEYQMADIAKLVDQLSELTVLEAADLAKALEEKWGVSAAAAVAAAPAAAARCRPGR
jgi:large subunit ribosomal protein L10